MSHITVSAAKVLEAANRVLKRIEEVRARRTEEAIAVQMRDKKYFLFGRTLTRDEAIARLEEDWSYPSCYAWETKEIVSRLVILVQHGDPVVITAEDAERLWG